MFDNFIKSISSNFIIEFFKVNFEELILIRNKLHISKNDIINDIKKRKDLELQAHLNRQRGMTDDQKKLFGIDKLNIKRSEIPAVTHVDYSARIQTVHKETNEKYFNLIQAFKEKTNCPVLINTSFNVRE